MSAAVAPHFILAIADPVSDSTMVSRLVDGLQAQCDRYLQVPGQPAIHLASLIPGTQGGPPALDDVVNELSEPGRALFIVPASLGLSLPAKELLSSCARDARRRHPDTTVHYCEPDPFDGALLGAFVGRAMEALVGATDGSDERPGAWPGSRPRAGRMPAPAMDRTGVLLVAAGDSDAPTRAQAYRAMRLIWEQLGLARGEVGFLRHARRTVPEALDECARTGLRWVVVPYYLWHATHMGYLRVICDDAATRRQAGRPAPIEDWPIAEPLGTSPEVVAWLWHAMFELWDGYLRARRTRQLSARRRPRVAPSRVFHPGIDGTESESESESASESASEPDRGIIIDLSDPDDLAGILAERSVDVSAEASAGASPGPILVKVTWHGYAPGTYTEPGALDTVLRALPGPALVIEGHTASRNRGGATWDWETESQEHRDWIREEDRVFRERTGVQRVLDAHDARYLNITEAWWDGDCAPAAEIAEILREQGIELHHPELMEYVPRALLAHRGRPLISLARFKGPTRLSLANLFGLLPMPLRTAWHGPNITYMARVCCDLARLYGALFALHGVVESLDAAVRWDRQGTYRSRWGNYDLIHRPGVLVHGRSVAVADVLASRLQGQDVDRSAFFDVVRDELGYPAICASAALDDDLRARFL